MKLSRRSLMLAASALMLTPLTRMMGLGQGDDARLMARLSELFPNSLRGAKAVGSACLADGAVTGSDEQLMNSLCPDRRLRRELAHAGDGDLRAWVRERVRGDFAGGRTVTVQGWILAESEVAIYALTART